MEKHEVEDVHEEEGQTEQEDVELGTKANDGEVGPVLEEGKGTPMINKGDCSVLEDIQISAVMTNCDGPVLEDDEEITVINGGDTEDSAGVVEMDMGEDSLCMVDENGMVLQKVCQ